MSQLNVQELFPFSGRVPSDMFSWRKIKTFTAPDLYLFCPYILNSEDCERKQVKLTHNVRLIFVGNVSTVESTPTIE